MQILTSSTPPSFISDRVEGKLKEVVTDAGEGNLCPTDVGVPNHTESPPRSGEEASAIPSDELSLAHHLTSFLFPFSGFSLAPKLPLFPCPNTLLPITWAGGVTGAPAIYPILGEGVRTLPSLRHPYECKLKLFSEGLVFQHTRRPERMHLSHRERFVRTWSLLSATGVNSLVGMPP